MNLEELDRISSAAVEKYILAKNSVGKYFLRSIMAGVFVTIAVLFSNTVSALFYSDAFAVGKLLSALIFPFSIMLIVFIGGELFTGNNMVMAFGIYQKKITWGNAVYTWVLNYLGNLVGTLILCTIFIGSGSSKVLLSEYFTETIMGKLDVPIYQLVLRGMLCNFMVCIAVLSSMKMKEEGAKIIVIIFSIGTFVVLGFEHCIANMGTFTLAYFMVDGLSLGLILRSMLFVTIGNMFGGVFLLAWPMNKMSA